MNTDLLPYLNGLDADTQDRLKKALSLVEDGDDSDKEPTQIREIEPLKSWLRSKYYNPMARSLYDYWEAEIIDFCEKGYNEWVITGSIGTGKSTAALVTAQRKLYELSCYDFPQRLFNLADMTKIFFAYLSVNIKQAELTGFGQIREQIDTTQYFRENWVRDKKISSIMKFPSNVFFIPGSDQISFIGTNLFGVVLDEMNFLRTKGGSVGDASKAQMIYQEASDRRRSRFMFQGKDPGFSLLVSSSTVQTSFTESRIKAAEQAAKEGHSTTKVTSTKLWEVKPQGTYSNRVFYVFNGSERDDAFLVEDPNDLLDLIDIPAEKTRTEQAIQALRPSEPTPEENEENLPIPEGDIHTDLVQNQVQLDPESQKLLYDNLPDLYLTEEEEEWTPGPSSFTPTPLAEEVPGGRPEVVEILSLDEVSEALPLGVGEPVGLDPSCTWKAGEACTRCEGEGWLWGHETDDPSPDTLDALDQRYPCSCVEPDLPAADPRSYLEGFDEKGEFSFKRIRVSSLPVEPMPPVPEGRPEVVPVEVLDTSGGDARLRPMDVLDTLQRTEVEQNDTPSPLEVVFGGESRSAIEADEGSESGVKTGGSMLLAPRADLQIEPTSPATPQISSHATTPGLDSLVHGLKKSPPKKVERSDTALAVEADDGAPGGRKVIQTRGKAQDTAMYSPVRGTNPWMDSVWEHLPRHLQNSISRVPVDFRDSFDSDLYTALKNIAGISIAPVGKLFTSRSLWARATRHEVPNPFRTESFPLTMKGSDQILDYFRAEDFFDLEAGEPRHLPYTPRYLRVDQSKNTDCTGIACVHRAGWSNTKGILEPVIRADFVIQIHPPSKPDKIGFWKVRNFILALRDLGLKIAGVSFDQYQSEDHQQILEMAGVKTSYLSVDRTDGAYVTTVNLLNEGRLEMYPYEPLRKEFFNLDWDRDKKKVDHPAVNPDGSKGTKDVADAFVGAVFDCVNGLDTGVPDRRDLLNQVRTIGPTISKRNIGRSFDWLLPKEYRGKVEIEVVKMGPESGGFDPNKGE